MTPTWRREAVYFVSILVEGRICETSWEIQNTYWTAYASIQLKTTIPMTGYTEYCITKTSFCWHIKIYTLIKETWPQALMDRPLMPWVWTELTGLLTAWNTKSMFQTQRGERISRRKTGNCAPRNTINWWQADTGSNENDTRSNLRW